MTCHSCNQLFADLSITRAAWGKSELRHAAETAGIERALAHAIARLHATEAENARLQDRVAELEAALAAFRGPAAGDWSD
jgi:hypothetical protein